MNYVDKKKLIPGAILLILAILSLCVVSKAATSARFHAKTIAALEEKQTTVLELTAATTAASAAITLLPGDAATPIAEKLADLSTGFLLVLCAIYLEKYLLTITGYVTFQVLIPAACLLYLLYLLIDREVLRVLARKLCIFGIAIVLVIPASVKLSGLIEDTYRTSIDATIETAKETAAEVESRAEETEESDEGFLSGILSSITDSITGIASDLSEKVGTMVNNFLEALAVMLVTSCVIPILVLLFFVWLVKVTFSLDLPPAGGGPLLRRKRSASRDQGEEKEKQ